MRTIVISIIFAIISALIQWPGYGDFVSMAYAAEQHNAYEQAIIRNAGWLTSVEDSKGYICVPADEYYGVPGDASLIGHAISVRIYAWVLTGNETFLQSALRSAQWLSERQDKNGGWEEDAGYALDAAQCVMEGFYTYEHFTGDKQFHETLIRAADRMISGTVDKDGNMLILNLTECGEYAHFSFFAWKATGLERHLRGGEAILDNIMDNFDEKEGFWNTAVAPDMNFFSKTLKFCFGPAMRFSMSRFDFKGKTVAKMSEHTLPYLMKGNGPQYTLGMMDAESLLDTLDNESLNFPRLRKQTEKAIEWVENNCAGPVEGSFVESKTVPKGNSVYPLNSINDTVNATMWPTSAYLLALVGLNDMDRYGERAKKVADWIISMQDEDGGFITHQAPDGKRFGEKYGNINFYASTALWYYNAYYVRGKVPQRSKIKD